MKYYHFTAIAVARYARCMSSDTEHLATTFAHFVCASAYQDLPATAVHAAKRAIVDTVGVAVGALHDDASSPILNYVRNVSSGAGLCTVIGQHERAAPEMAALANGTLAHLLDFDDTHNPMGGHPSAPVLSAALAMADHAGASGRDLILAFVAGFEVTTKLARVTNPLLYSRGWHPTSVLAVFGAAAAAAKLLRLDKAQMTHALAAAASMASGMKANFATLTKPLHVGRAAQAGVQSAMLAACGHTANPAIFEAPMGYLDLYCSQKQEDWKLGTVEKRLGEPWEIVQPGVTVKPYPCGGSTHSTIDAHLALRAQHEFASSDIVKIRNGIHARRLPHTSRPVVTRGLEGKFSNQYVTALCWLKGSVLLADFDDATAGDPAMAEMMRKVQTYAEPEISASAEETHALVEVTLRDGTVYQQRTTKRRGSPANPLSDAELGEKFRSCVPLVFSREKTERLLERIWKLDSLQSARALTTELAA
jgi:2-methylcitrate dehydratase PrpD